ncbi:MAG: 3-isopropylmalate dehydrogenase [Sphingomonadales bacterium]|nr:3-isopropylmalate dehydrogenase [Sphingomonadales bacterium]
MSAHVLYLPGDGIGPEVGKAAMDVLQATAKAFSFNLTIEEGLIGGAAIDSAGHPFPDATRAACDKADAVFLAAVGGPKWDNCSPRPEVGLLELRAHLGVFANIRPVKPHAAVSSASPLKPEILEGVDMVVIRELTGGIYFGKKTRTETSASDECVYTVKEIERIIRHAARLAQTRTKKLVSVDKANILETSRLWREVTTRVMADEFPDVEVEHILVDAAAMHLISRPSSFDVIVTENMFGDILTDEASMLAGSMGVLPSASLGEGPRGLYEPIHGSAPDIAGKGIANPLAAILSVALMLRQSLGRDDAACAVEKAVDTCLTTGKTTPDLGGTLSTVEVAQAVAAALDSV